MSLPNRTTILIVGAGPSGLACAISLLNQGCRDIIIVDAVLRGETASRALVIHSATLEALDTVQCAKPLIELGAKSDAFCFRERSSHLIAIDVASLYRYTRYPFNLLLPQYITEGVLIKKLKDLGVKVFRPYRLTSMRANIQDRDTVDACFDSGQVIQASYVIGADGVHSVVRQLAGIDFIDPDCGAVKHNNLMQMIAADVTFSSPITIGGSPICVIAENNFFFISPLTPSMTDNHGSGSVYRIGCGVPTISGPPPSTPPATYLQNLLDRFGPIELSSDPSVNPNPVHISRTLWSTRFKTQSAAADRFFTRFGGNGSTEVKRPCNADRGAAIMLVGDAAHINSPIGGQGMNLGIRDAIFLGPIIATHIKQCQSQPTSTMQTSDPDAVLYEFASVRRSRALRIISQTKELMNVIDPLPSKWFWWFPVSYITIRNMVVRILGRFQFARRMAAWRLSGLGAQ